ncbi:Ribosomal biogenesis protein RLP24 [Fasciola hepatica]|uniref:Probable ribosome biogenesis protein RLP24 n=1 Tax=Fasciola hepatica TaxID=6192 RepID=A0A4E0RWF6_FASHE|nr:Ribosomal biogenesis protein RLP24 [Fasciola hepatica]
MRIYRCWFCSSPIYPGHGTLFVRNDCKEFRFCRGKCHKAFKKHRNPRKVKWTKVARKCQKKELTDDLAQTFEKKRNSLLRYERDALLKTVEAVPKIVAIKQKREAAFIRKRLMKGIENRRAEDIKLVNTQIHLIKAPNAKEKITRMETSSEEEEDMDVSLSRLEEEAEKEKKPAPKKKSSVRAKQKLMLKA